MNNYFKGIKGIIIILVFKNKMWSYPFYFILYSHFVKSLIIPKPFLKMQTPIMNTKIEEKEKKSADERYNLNWYVVGESNQIQQNKLYKTTVWSKDYLFWQDNDKQFYAMDDDCSHRGASLGLGKLENNRVICPYHGYEFDTHGTLCVVPGLDNFTNTFCQNQATYRVVEKNGWVFLNTVNTLFYEPSAFGIQLFEEEEAENKRFAPIFLNVGFKAYGRVVSENSLDIMHIGFVHSFGNKERPRPITEIPPFLVNDYSSHYNYKTIYTYNSGKQSVAKKIYGMKKLTIENEFAIPHTTIARVIFGDYISTVVTFATPINITYTRLYVKTYRNFWYTPEDEASFFDLIINKIGDFLSERLMMNTVLEDRVVLENIRMDKFEGRFNMKYDKLQNIYRQLYKKLVHCIKNEEPDDE